MPLVKLPREALPGERLAVMEEFEGGEGTYPAEGAIRALAIGEAFYDLSRRVVRVRPLKPKSRIPVSGDVVLGEVESVQSNAVNVRISHINEEKSQGSFMGMITLPQEKLRREPRVASSKRVAVRPCDLIKAKVVSSENRSIHLSIDGEEDGVVYTLCSTCGGGVVRVKDGIKCVECGNREYRKISADFGRLQLVRPKFEA